MTFIIIWKHCGNHEISVYRFVTSDEAVMDKLDLCQNEFIYHADPNARDEDEKMVASVWEDHLNNKVELIDHSTKQPIELEGQFTFIITGYYHEPTPA